MGFTFAIKIIIIKWKQNRPIKLLFDPPSPLEPNIYPTLSSSFKWVPGGEFIRPVHINSAFTHNPVVSSSSWSFPLPPPNDLSTDSIHPVSLAMLWLMSELIQSHLICRIQLIISCRWQKVSQGTFKFPSPPAAAAAASRSPSPFEVGLECRPTDRPAWQLTNDITRLLLPHPLLADNDTTRRDDARQGGGGGTGCWEEDPGQVHPPTGVGKDRTGRP